MLPTDPHPFWFDQLCSRFVAHWLLKSVLIPLFMSGFFAGYFCLLRHPLFPVAIIPLTALDRLIAFCPSAVWFYASLWFYALLGAALLRGRREWFVYGLAVVTLTVIGFGTFLLWPNATPPPHANWALYPPFRFLGTVDAAGNACPSLHVAFAVFTAVWLERLLRQGGASVVVRALNGAWCLAIVYSTLATRQHVTIDALAGAALGGAVGLLDPRTPGSDLRAPYSWLNRQCLAFAVSATAKILLFVLGLAQTDPAMAALLFFGPDLWILAGLVGPNITSLMPTATRFATDQREVWLTIDDGPEPATAIPMLDLLDRHGAKATFFAIGEKASAHPELVAEICRRGHTVGNHTQTHPLAAFWLAGPRRTAREVDACDAALQRAGAAVSPWFRAPAGIKTFFLRRVLADRGRVLVGWSARGRETFSASPAAPLRRLQRNIRPGAILLVHESATNGAARVALLTALLEHLSATGYRCVLPERDALR
jgi:peptidoglycan/xylan/chitin deacetylase (PgdA/CDA1 family)